MKTFLQLIEEKEKTEKPVVMAFGRMNPPTTGHLKLIDKVKEVAAKNNAKHTVVVSHSQDSKKNPLSGEQKIKHLKRYSPGTHFETSSKEHPTILHAATKLNAKGHDHLIVVAGSDRVKEMHHLLHKYNGVKSGHGMYNFKKIQVVSAGHRDPDAEGEEGISGTKMREYAKHNNFSKFREGVPSHVQDHHAKELMKDVRKGMGLNEQWNRGQFKAIFVTGGPGSGKDIIIRESIAESKTTELNFIQAFEYLADKQKLAEKTTDLRRESLRNRMPLIINGPADDIQKIEYIKEELESLGYETLMVFVDTTNEQSQERNTKLSRMMVESVRHDKWLRAQNNKKLFSESFDTFVYFDNNKSIEYIEEDITETYQIINQFFDGKLNNQIANDWLENHNILNSGNIIKEQKNVEKVNRFIRFQKSNIRADGPGDIPADNRTIDRNADDIKYNAGKRTKTYTFGSGAGVYAESEKTGSDNNNRFYREAKAPTLTKRPEPKESNFSQDKEKLKFKKRGDKSLQVQGMVKPSGVGQEYDTRAGGQGAAAGAGLGNQTYSETIDYSDANNQSTGKEPNVQPNPLSSNYDKPKKPFKYFRKAVNEYNGFQNDTESGLGGVLGGAGNSEKMDSYKDPMRNVQNDYGLKIKKKKKQEK